MFDSALGYPHLWFSSATEYYVPQNTMSLIQPMGQQLSRNIISVTLLSGSKGKWWIGNILVTILEGLKCLQTHKIHWLSLVWGYSHRYEWVWKDLCPQFVHDFGGFEKVDEESKEVFSNLVTLSNMLELDLQEDDFIELLAVQHKELINEDLMESEIQGKDQESPEESCSSTGELKRFTTRKLERGYSLWGGTVGFWVTGPKHRTGQEGHGSCSECHPVLPCHLQGEKKGCYPDITESFSPEGR